MAILAGAAAAEERGPGERRGARRTVAAGLESAAVAARTAHRTARFLRLSPTFVPALAVVGMLVLFAADGGGYPPSVWYPGALLALALLGLAVLVLPAPRPPSRLAVAAALLLGLYACWAALSVLWADHQAVAYEGATRTLFYAIVFALFALWPLRGEAAAVLLGVFGLGIAAVALVVLLRADGPQAARHFLGGRLAAPTGYQNASVAIWTTGFWACIVLAGRRWAPAAVRGLALGGAFVLITAALLGQSRGWLFTFPAGVLLLLALVPGRLRTGAALIAVGLAAYLARDPLLAVFDGARGDRAIAPLLAAAMDRVVPLAAILALAGTAVALAGSAVRRRRRGGGRRARLLAGRRRRWAAVAAAAGAIVLLAGGVALAASAEGPRQEIDRAWTELRRGSAAEDPDAGRSRFSGSLQTNRYDLWRVALDLFSEQPVRGVGIGNFQEQYLARARTQEQPNYPHSLPLGVLSQTGIVGGALLVAALMAAVAAAARAALRGSATAAAVAATALVTFLAWLLHASVDWFWEFPALGGAALALLGLAAGLAPSRARGRPAGESGAGERGGPPPRPAFGVAASVLVAAALAVPAAAFALPWLADRETRRAVAAWRTSPAVAFERLERAQRLNPLATRPALTAGIIAIELDRPGLAEHYFRRALARDPRDPFALLQLGAVLAEQGQATRARVVLRRARRAAPRDYPILATRDRLAAGKSISARAVNRLVVEFAPGQRR